MSSERIMLASRFKSENKLINQALQRSANVNDSNYFVFSLLFWFRADL